MSHVLLRGATVAAVTFVILGGTVTSQAQPAAQPRVSQPVVGKKQAAAGTAEARIRAALAEPTILEFVETPLTDVVDYLKEYHKIDIKLRKKTLDEIAIPIDMPLSFTARDIRLESALQLMLGDLGLDWVIANEVLLITSQQDVNSRYELRTYDISGLVDQTNYAEQLADVVRTTITRPAEAALNPSGPPLPGRTISVFNNLLIVRDTERTHAQIEWLLEQMRAELARPVSAPPANP